MLSEETGGRQPGQIWLLAWIIDPRAKKLLPCKIAFLTSVSSVWDSTESFWLKIGFFVKHFFKLRVLILEHSKFQEALQWYKLQLTNMSVDHRLFQNYQYQRTVWPVYIPTQTLRWWAIPCRTMRSSSTREQQPQPQSQKRSLVT